MVQQLCSCLSVSCRVQFQEFLSLRGIGRSNPKTAGQDVLKVLAAMQSRAEIPFAYALQDMADHKRQTVSAPRNHYSFNVFSACLLFSD